MRLRQLIHGNFDVNANIKVFIGIHNDGGKLVYETCADINSEYSLEDLQDRKVVYMTTGDDGSIIVEVEDDQNKTMRLIDFLKICETPYTVFVHNNERHTYAALYDSEHGVLKKSPFTEEQIKNAKVIHVSAEHDWQYDVPYLAITIDL